MKPQVLAAISAAISAYVADEEAYLAATMVQQAAMPSAPSNLWGVAGRQTASQMRMLMQRRSFK